MDEIIPGLWIGSLASALDIENLKARGIYSILSAMRGRITIHETFIRHQISLDDTEDADILVHLLPSIHFIEAELGKGRGVLVHCQAGVSRSSTIVAAYLMCTQNLDPQAALEIIRRARPIIEPNAGFLRQLEIFHRAQYRISRQDKNIRLFYMDRTVTEVMNGDGSPSETDMFAHFPPTPSEPMPSTFRPPKRRIRCKMCRQELAAREHMLDHGQVGPETPANSTPAGSRRPSATVSSLLPSNSTYSHISSTVSFSALSGPVESPQSEAYSPLGDLRSLSKALEQSVSPVSAFTEEEPFDDSLQQTPTLSSFPSGISIQQAENAGKELSDAIKALPSNGSGLDSGLAQTDVEHLISIAETAVLSSSSQQPVSDPDNPEGQQQINPLSAPLVTAIASSSSASVSSSISRSVNAPPILINPKCSGYFVEPMKWMDHFLQKGEMAGKIVCPNKKCGAKLGNYDWAGVCCGCKQWVTPGFCINRSKVDEITV